jgi:hypothetical protein
VASTLKQQSAGRHVSPLGYWIHYPDSEQTSLSPYCYLPSGETINTNFIVFGLTRPGLEPQSTAFKTLQKRNHNIDLDKIQINPVFVLSEQI